MSSLIKIRNIIYIILILIILMVVSYAMAYIVRQNREYARLNQESLVREKVEDIVKQESNDEKDIPEIKEDRVEIGDTEFRSGNDIIIF